MEKNPTEEIMSFRNGDKSRANRQRKTRIKQRVRVQELTKSAQAAPKASGKTKASK
jgi:hypothetical protein